MEAGGWRSSKAAQRYIHLHDEALKEAAERLSAIKPGGIRSLTVTTTGISDNNGVDRETQTVETRPMLA